VALSVDAKQQGRYQRVDTLELEPMKPVTVYLEGSRLRSFSSNKSSQTRTAGIQYLVTSDTTLDGNGIATIYQKRWNVEPYHKSLKQNASLEKSPTKTVTTQTNHFFAALCAYIKVGAAQRQHQTQSLCSQIKIVRTRYPIGLHCSSETQSRSIGCVR
jgi:hypothetical protein